ncbi:fumarylacetoacetate hydrolase family protein [Paenibacillus sp. NPDC058071]|uniref:fumarylacetoacetate hydrolase family protein n=1 Tax=Paenibacillus sp. NPDC058071 TaxID=3346326 RepID=UPI0036DAFF42
MKYVTVHSGGREQLGVVTPHGIALIATINADCGTQWSTEMFVLLQEGQLKALTSWLQSQPASSVREWKTIASSELKYAPLYRHPRKIWGVGFNYTSDEEELRRVDREVEPVGFMKPDTSLIGYGDTIQIPLQSERTIAEAELAIIIGQTCKEISEDDALQYVAGYAAVFDIGADDIHSSNPRYLTRSKSFDTFFSFGPELVTTEELANLADLTVATVRNGEVIARKPVGLMRYQPAFIVSFHSRFMTLLPGDVIMTGTPGSVVIRPGDCVECRIDGFEPLVNIVK